MTNESTVPSPEFEQALRDLAAELGRPAQQAKEMLPPGTVVGGHFEIERRIGSGGMGVVHLARDTRLDRPIALKLVRSEDHGRGARRLEREARAMAQLADPHVVAVFEVGHHEGAVYIAMELVQGSSARQWARERTRTSAEIVDVYLQAARGLAAAHAAGLVHRDFKPDNVLVGREGRVRVADFGLARPWQRADVDEPTSSASAASRLGATVTDAVAGTPGYIAPELYLGGAPSPGTDQFALGVALYQALFDRPPYGNLPLSAAAAPELPADTALPRRVPSWLRRLVLRTIATDPAARFPSMDAVVTALEHGRGSARRRWIGVLGGGTLVIVAAIGIVVGSGARERPCDDAEAAAQRVWSAEQRERVASAFLIDEPAAQITWRVAAPRLEEWVAQWIEDRRASCMATRVHGSQSEQLLDRSIACLDARLSDLDALVDTLAAQRSARARADTLVSQLRTTGPCRDHAYLSARVEPPVDPEDRAEAERIEDEIRRIRFGFYAGDDLAAQEERFVSLLAAARRLAYAPAIASVEIQSGVVDLAADRRDDARTRWRRAYFDASVAGDDDTAARAALHLAFLAGSVSNDRESAEIWLDLVSAGIARGHVDPSLLAKLEFTRSQVLQRAEDFEGGIAAARHALALIESTSTDAVTRLHARSELAAALDAAGDHRAALVEYDAVYTETAALYGDDHPLIAHVLGNRGLAHFDLGEFAAAAADQERALAIELPRSGAVASTASNMLNLGLTLVALGRVDEGVASLERALAVWRGVGDRLDEALALDAIGWAELGRGEAARALPRFREALAIRRAEAPEGDGELALSFRHIGDAHMKLGDADAALISFRESLAAQDRVDASHPDRAWPLYGLARASFATGEHADAERFATAVIELASRRDVDPKIVALAHFERAQAWDETGPRPRALDEARLALELLRRSEGDTSSVVDEIEQWLRERS